jgi:MFS family permease
VANPRSPQAYGVGNGLGAALGGFLCDKLGWRSAFYIQLPFIAVYGVLAVIACPSNLGPNFAKTQGRTMSEAFKSFDAYGTLAMTLTVSGIILGVNLGGNVFPWSHPLVIFSLVTALLAGTCLIFVERRVARPILPLRLFTTHPVANVIGANFGASMTVSAVLFNVPLFLQAVKQTSPTTSGLYLFPPLAGAAFMAILTGIYITITRRLKPPMLFGAVFALIGTFAVSSLSKDTPIHIVPWLVPWASIGQGFFFPAATIAVLALNTQEDQAVATTTLGLVRNLGSILGVALSSWILQNALPVYLNQYVTAPNEEEKQQIIRTVRESIQAIRRLDPLHKEQVISAYSLSLRATFFAALAFATISAIIIFPAKLPRLQKQEDMDSPTAGAFMPEEDDSTSDGTSTSDGSEDEERALLATPTETISRVTTNRTSRSRTLSRRSTSLGAQLERRASFDTQF